MFCGFLILGVGKGKGEVQRWEIIDGEGNLRKQALLRRYFQPLSMYGVSTFHEALFPLKPGSWPERYLVILLRSRKSDGAPVCHG